MPRWCLSRCQGASPQKTDLRGPVALVRGSEGRGPAALTRKLCDAAVTLDMAAPGCGVDSYNVSVAAGILLYDIMQRRKAAALPGQGGKGRDEHAKQTHE